RRIGVAARLADAPTGPISCASRAPSAPAAQPSTREKKEMLRFPAAARLRGPISTAALCAAVLAAPGPARAQDLPTATPESVGMSTERLARLDATLQRYIDDRMVAGTVALVARNGKVVHLKA